MKLKNKFKNSKGSITLYVLISLSFFYIMVFGIYNSASNKMQKQEKELEKVQEKYESENISDVYEETHNNYISAETPTIRVYDGETLKREVLGEKVSSKETIYLSNKHVILKFSSKNTTDKYVYSTSPNGEKTKIEGNTLEMDITTAGTTIYTYIEDLEGNYSKNYTAINMILVTLQDKTIYVEEGKETNIGEIQGENAGKITFEQIADSTIATLEENKVKGIKAGTTTFIAKEDKAEATATITIKVVKIELEFTNKTMLVGDSTKAKITGINNGILSAKINDKELATVDLKDNEIIITAKKEGNAVITITENNVNAEATCQIKIASIALKPNGGTYTMPTKGEARIETTVTTVNAEKIETTWSDNMEKWDITENNQLVEKTNCKEGTYYLYVRINGEEIYKSKEFIVGENTLAENKITIKPSTTTWTKDNITATVTYGSTLTSNKKAGYGTTLEKAITVASESTSTNLTATENGYFYAEATDVAGNKVTTSLQITKIDRTAPSVENVEIKNVNTTGYDVYVYGVQDSGSGVNRVQFPTWTDYNGQDDIQSGWQTAEASKGVKQSDGTTWVYRVNTTDHKNEAGKYYTYIYTYDNIENSLKVSEQTVTVPTVKITYDENYNSAKTTVDKAYNTELGELSTPTRTGYTFAGWYTEPTGGTQISSTTLTPADNTTYYAHWTINKYYIDLNMSVDGTIYDTGYNSRIYVGLKIGGIDKGYIQDYHEQHDYNTSYEIYGLKLDEKEIKYSKTGIVDALDLDLKLNFYTLTLNVNNSAYGSVSPTTLIVPDNNTVYITNGENLTLSDGRTATATAKPITGYTTKIVNWSPETGTITNTTTVTANFNSTAKTYTILYDGNGNTGGSTASHTVTYGQNAEIATNGFAKTGYTFAGWTTKSDGTDDGYKWTNWKGTWKYVDGKYGIADGKLQLYAMWKANTYEISYDGNGSTGGSTASHTVTYGQNAEIATNGFTKTGYTFAGWTTKSDGTDDGYKWTNWKGTWKFVDGKYGIADGKLQLYAMWKANTYEISYDGNGSTGGSTASHTVTYGQNAAIATNGFTKTGYTFAGWTTKLDGTDDGYGWTNWKGTWKYVDGKYGISDGKLQLYAVWKDTISPTTPIIEARVNNESWTIYDGSWTNNNVYVKLTSTDDGSGIKQYEWYENGEWTTRALTTNSSKIGEITYTAQRNETLKFRAIDEAGNVSNESTLTLKIDKDTPTIGSIAGTTEKGNTGKVMVNNIADTGGSGLKGIYISTSSTKPTATNVTWETITDNSFTKNVNDNGTYYVWVIDNAGNISEVQSCKVSGIVAKVTKVTLTNAIVKKGSKITINKNLEGSTEYKSISFISGTTAKATIVSETGVATGVAAGTSTITCTVTNYDGTTIKGTCILTVVDLQYSPNGGSYALPYTDSTAGTATIKSTVTISGATTSQYAWTASSKTEPTSWSTYNVATGGTPSKTSTYAATYYLWNKIADGNGNYVTYVSNAFVITANKITITPSTTTMTNKDITCTIAYPSATTSSTRKAGYGTSLSSAKTAAGSATAPTTNLTVTENGVVYAEATDTAGNKVTASLQISNIDKTGPSLGNISATKTISFTNGTSVFLSNSASETSKVSLAIIPANSTVNYTLSGTINGAYITISDTKNTAFQDVNASGNTSGNASGNASNTDSFETGNSTMIVMIQVCKKGATAKINSIKNANNSQYNITSMVGSKLLCCTSTTYANDSYVLMNKEMTLSLNVTGSSGTTNTSYIYPKETFGASYGYLNKFYPRDNESGETMVPSSWYPGSISNVGKLSFSISSASHKKDATDDGIIVKLSNNTSVTGANLNNDSYMPNRGPYGYNITIPCASESGSTTKYTITGDYSQSETAITSTTTRYIPVGCKVTVTATDSLGNETIKTLDLN